MYVLYILISVCVCTHDSVRILSALFSTLHPLIFQTVAYPDSSTMSGLVVVDTVVCKNPSCCPSKASALSLALMQEAQMTL